MSNRYLEKSIVWRMLLDEIMTNRRFTHEFSCDHHLKILRISATVIDEQVRIIDCRVDAPMRS